MNLAVDYNELLFLSLVVLLVADICFYWKDFNRAFYFYNQAVFFLSHRELQAAMHEKTISKFQGY